MGQGIDLWQYSSDGYDDVTGTDYAIGQPLDHIADVALEADLRARAADDARRTVVMQAVVAMHKGGLSVREIARRLHLSKSDVARRLRRAPYRTMPQPEVDNQVAQVWADGLDRVRERPAPRPGDKAGSLTVRINMLDGNPAQ